MILEREIIDRRPVHKPWLKMVGDLDVNGRPEVIVAGAEGSIASQMTRERFTTPAGNDTWTRAVAC